MSDLFPFVFDTAILAGGVGPSSMKMYARDFRTYLAYAGSPEQAIQASTLARWRAHLALHTSLSPNTINRMMSAVKRLMKAADAQGYVPAGTCEQFKHVEGVRVVALKDRQKANARTRIEPEQMRMLTSLPDTLTLVGLRDAALLHTLASSGLRIHELASLQRRNVLNAGVSCFVLVRGKNDIEFRHAPLSHEAYEAIGSWLKARPVASEYIFTSFEGKGDRASQHPMREVSIWRIVKRYAAQCDLEDIKPHDFRRFVGTQLAKRSPRSAQLALGHKRIGTTMDNYVLDELEPNLTDNLY